MSLGLTSAPICNGRPQYLSGRVLIRRPGVHQGRSAPLTQGAAPSPLYPTLPGSRVHCIEIHVLDLVARPVHFDAAPRDYSLCCLVQHLALSTLWGVSVALYHSHCRASSDGHFTILFRTELARLASFLPQTGVDPFPCETYPALRRISASTVVYVADGVNLSCVVLC